MSVKNGHLDDFIFCETSQCCHASIQYILLCVSETHKALTSKTSFNISNCVLYSFDLKQYSPILSQCFQCHNLPGVRLC